MNVDIIYTDFFQGKEWDPIKSFSNEEKDYLCVG